MVALIQSKSLQLYCQNF